MPIRKIVLLIMAFLVLQLSSPGIVLAAEPAFMIAMADGWTRDLYEDKDISVLFAMVNLKTYVRIINKTDKVMRFSWPAASFLLPDGTARTLCFMYEKVVSDGLEKVPLTPSEKQQKSLPPGVISASKFVSKQKTVLLPGSEGLLIPSGCAIFCQLGFNANKYASASGGSVKGLLPELMAVSTIAEAEFYYVISGFATGSIFEWSLQYDYAGNERCIPIRLRMQ